jgi:hypothetical protein
VAEVQVLPVLDTTVDQVAELPASAAKVGREAAVGLVVVEHKVPPAQAQVVITATKEQWAAPAAA